MGREQGAGLSVGAGAGRLDAPLALHAQVAVNRPARVEAVEDVFAAAEHFEGGVAGEVEGGELGPAQVAAGEWAAGEHLVEALGGAPDGVAFRHGARLDARGSGSSPESDDPPLRAQKMSAKTSAASAITPWMIIVVLPFSGRLAVRRSLQREFDEAPAKRNQINGRSRDGGRPHPGQPVGEAVHQVEKRDTVNRACADNLRVGGR